MEKPIIMIRNITISLFCILFSIHSIAQDKKSLEERAIEYYNYIINEEYDSLVNYIDQSNFKYVSKKELAKYLKEPEQSERFSLFLLNTPPKFNFNEIKKINEAYYCVYYLDQTMKIKFHDEISKEEINAVIEYLKQKYKTDKAVYNPRMNAIHFSGDLKI